MTRSETTIRLDDEVRTERIAGSSAHRLVLGRYRLTARLGAGGFGVVWRAYDERLERDVAVKVVPSGGDHADDARVQREAVAAARLNHPGIVALYELGQDGDAAYLVSELVDGATLADLTRAEAVSDRDVARIGVALCDALDHAHARGVIHRDVKPGNVMVLAEPAAGAGFAKLTDFGIARLVSGDALTAPGDVVGTLAYMSPEQAEGGAVGPESDVYSLALTLYEAWTGSNPVRADSPAATARRLGSPLPPLRSARRDLPPALCEAVDAALDADPAYRPRLDELRDVLAGAEPALGDRGGLVETETLDRFGLTAARPRTGLTRVLASVVAARVGAGAGAGALVAVALAYLGPSPPFSIPAAAAVAALVVALLPRAGWIAAAVAVCGWLASPDAGREGTAVVVAAAVAPVPLLLPRAGLLWSLPGLAPLLGIVALGPLFVGVAASCSSAWRRGALATLGFLWLAAGATLRDAGLPFGVASPTPPSAGWEHSPVAAIDDALLPLASSLDPVLPLAWVAAAVALGPIVRAARHGRGGRTRAALP